MARIILDAVTESNRLDHFEIEPGTLVNPLRLDKTAFLLELCFPVGQFRKNIIDGCILSLGQHYVVRLWVDW